MELCVLQIVCWEGMKGEAAIRFGTLATILRQG